MTTQHDIYDLQSTKYLATDETVARMAKDYSGAHISAGNVRGAYLRVLVAHTRQALAASSGPTKDQQLEALRVTHERLYTVVLTAVTTDDIAPDASIPKPEQTARALERNRRSVFARTAKSTLMTFVKAGGDIPGLDPESVTKEWLRQVARALVPLPSAPDATSAAEGRLTEMVRKMAERDREEAIEFIDQLHVKLMMLVATPLTRLTMKRGDVTLHPSA